MWKGKWDSDHKVFTGTYTFADGGVFDGTATLTDVHRVELKDSSGTFSKVSEHPCEPYWTFTGNWSKDGKGYSIHMPPAPDVKHS